MCLSRFSPGQGAELPLNDRCSERQRKGFDAIIALNAVAENHVAKQSTGKYTGQGYQAVKMALRHIILGSGKSLSDRAGSHDAISVFLDITYGRKEKWQQ